MLEEIMDEDDEIPAGFFTKRAKLAPKKTAEDLQAAAELLAKIQEENSESPVKSTKKTAAPKSRPKRNQKKKDQTPPKDDSKDGITDDSFSEVSLSSAAKRRLKKLQDEQLQDIKMMEFENQKILSGIFNNVNLDPCKEVDLTEDFRKETSLTVMYMSKVCRLKCFEEDKFVYIFPKVAELFNLKVTEFLLCLETRNIVVDDTPKNLGITDRDILECIPYKTDEKSNPDEEDTGYTFKINFQSNDSKDKIQLVVHKLEKMEESMKRYSKQRTIPLDQLVFYFDGEKISGDETPAELDMESESCIDVTVLEPPSQLRTSPRKKIKIPECITL